MERYDVEHEPDADLRRRSVPTDCGYDMGAGNMSPRLGLAYRMTEAIVLRGGYGINYDPYPLAFVRNLLGNYPSSINLSLPQASAFAAAGRLRDGIPPIPVPDVSSGVIPVPLNVSARALPEKPKRGYIHSWNVTVQSELPGGFTGQAGYVAHTAARHQPDHGCERGTGDWRRQCRPSAVPEVRAHGRDRHSRAIPVGATTTRCRRR